MFHHVAGRRMQNQVPGAVQRVALRACETELNVRRIRAECNTEIVFELDLVPVINHIEAWIHSLVLGLGIVRDVRMPQAWVVADEIVG
jgi:hypothetical protein